MDQVKYSTASLAHGKFRAHGYVEVAQDGNLLRHQAWGPFNDELVTAFSAMAERLSPQMAALGRWGDLVIFHRSALASPTTFDAFGADTQQRAARGLAAHVTALVMPPEVEGGELMTMMFLKLYQQLGLEAQGFVDPVLAERWIMAQLGRGG